ncbi:MAG TPA: BsuPI-related putative proteinase inhibitor [Gemmatimonadales bacterium]|nr:BsuPI-related putative proteinase inhibitor [Gemmatimonadales bacterium]
MWTWGGAAVCGAALLAPGLPQVTGAPQPPDTIRFTVVAPDSVRPGEPVPIALHITNTSDRPVDLYVSGRTITFDIIVARDGEVVWRRLKHTSTQQILQVKTLSPGKNFELKDSWRQRTNAGAPVAPGDYTVTGIIPTDREPLRTAPARLRITPRR